MMVVVKRMVCAVAAAVLFSHSLCATLAPNEALASSIERYQEANTAYTEGAFAEAKKGYEALIDEGHRGANLFYNLGNASYRLGEKGGAVLNFQRALVMEPRHPEATANLEFVRRELGSSSWAQPLWEKALEWPEALSQGRAAWGAAFGIWVLAVSVAPLLWRRRALIPGMVLGGAVALWCCGAIWSVTKRPALWIVTEKSAPVRPAPVDTAKPTQTVPWGSEVRVVLERGPWLYVALPGGDERGWMSREALGPVRVKPLELQAPLTGG